MRAVQNRQLEIANRKIFFCFSIFQIFSSRQELGVRARRGILNECNRLLTDNCEEADFGMATGLVL